MHKNRLVTRRKLVSEDFLTTNPHNAQKHHAAYTVLTARFIFRSMYMGYNR